MYSLILKSGCTTLGKNILIQNVTQILNCESFKISLLKLKHFVLKKSIYWHRQWTF